MSTNINDLLSLEKIEEFNTDTLIDFLIKQKKLNLDADTFKIFHDEKIAGYDFIKLTEEKLGNIGIKTGPSTRITEFVETLKDINERHTFECRTSYGKFKKDSSFVASILENLWKQLCINIMQ